MTFHSYQSTFHQMAKLNEHLKLNFANNSMLYIKKKVNETMDTGLL